MMKKFNPNLGQLIKILNDGEFHDGNTIGNSLGITRSGVWKTVQKLESYGLEIDSIKGMGYRLREPIQLLDKDYIIAKTKSNKFKLDLFETIDSTSGYLQNIPVEKHPKFCLAEQQTLGRGRLGRSWYSPFGRNVYLSGSYLFPKDIGGLSGLSLVVALAVIDVFKQYVAVEKLKAKWPNDVVFAGKKCSGILVYIQAEANGFSSVIIGVGLNVNMVVDTSHQISQSWTSLRKITGSCFDRNEICAAMINSLSRYLEIFVADGLLKFAAEWSRVDYLFAKEISIKTAAGKVIGRVKGIDRLGQLLLEFPDGTVNAFSSGDTAIIREKL